MTNPYLNRDMIAKVGLELMQANAERVRERDAVWLEARDKAAEWRRAHADAAAEYREMVSREAARKLPHAIERLAAYRTLRAAYHARAWK